MTDQNENNPAPSLQAEETAALDRIAHSFDGLMLHRYLRRILETCVDFEDSGALRTQNGRRSLARDLMRLMANGIEAQTSGRDYAIVPGGKPSAVNAGAGLAGLAAQRRQWRRESDDDNARFNDTFRLPDDDTPAKPNGDGSAGV